MATTLPPLVFLIGPMGAGKTTVGRRLARHLEYAFIDLDEEIERRTGASIPWIFDIEGEEGFRDREQAVLGELASGRQRVIATGGGAVLREANRQLLRQNGFVVHLKVSVDRQLDRLRRDRRRPLLAAPDRRARLEDLARARAQLYRDTAHLEVDAEQGSPAATARRVLTALGLATDPARRHADPAPSPSAGC